VPKSHDVYEKPTDADYKAWRKKQGGIRDSKNARKRFENAWRKEHRGDGEADAEAPKEPTPAAEPTESAGAKTAEQEAKETRREAFRNDPVLQRIDAEYKKAKTDAERNALRDAFEARVKELQRKGLKVPKDAAPTEPPKEEAPKEEATAEAEPKDEAPKEEAKAKSEAPKEAETPSSASDAKPANAEAEAEAPKPKSKGKKTKAAKADAKKAAKVVENFVSKDVTRKALSQVHHDHEGVPDDAVVVVRKVHAEFPGAVRNPGARGGELPFADIGVENPREKEQQSRGDKPRTDLPFPRLFPFPRLLFTLFGA
jgi:hypothetical protein